MKKITSILLILTVLLTVVACGSSENEEVKDRIQVIKDRGELIVGVKEDVPNFGLLDPATGEIKGFEVDLAGQIAKEILGDETKVKLVGVTSKTRGALLDSGEVDMLIATFTITEERKETYDFTTPYYEDPVGLLVKESKGFADLASLEGKTLGVMTGTTGRNAVQGALDELKIEAEFVELPGYPDIKTALEADRVDAFVADGSILSNYKTEGYVILPDRFAPQEYGIATNKNYSELGTLVNKSVEKWLKDGTIDKMLENWNISK